MTHKTRNIDKSWEREVVLKWTNWSSQNEVRNKYFGVTTLKKNNADQDSQCLAERSEKLLEDSQSLDPSPCLFSLLYLK